jgi:phosphate transport system permease protein
MTSQTLVAGRRRSNADVVFRWALRSAGAAVLVILALMVGATTWRAWPVFQHAGLHFFTGSDWSPGFSQTGVTGTYGALPFIYGTIVSSLIALVIGVPLSLGVALTLVEIAPKRLSRLLSYAVDLLAAVPSVIYGLWGVLFFVPVVLKPVMEWFSSTLGGVIPIFRGPVWSTNYFAAGVVHAIMIVPIIAAISREIFTSVPDGERYAAYALGATRWEVIRHAVLPRSRAGIVGASMLGLGRALGETIAVALLIGGGLKIDVGIFHPGYSIAALIANTFQEASPEGVRALIAIGVTLFGITVLINVFARILVWRFGQPSADV